MQWTDRIRQVKILLVVAAVVIAVLSLVVSHLLTRDLSDEERSKMEVWSEAMRALNQADENTDLALVLKVIDQNHTIPVVVMGADGQAQFFRNVNVDGDNYEDSLRNAQQLGQQWLNNKQHIRIQLSDSTAGDYIDVCYDDSVMLRRLQTYPFVQLGVVMIFVVVAIFALLTSKRAEQNKVWVGLSKETAHQLGTPISSLMAWTEILKESYPDDDLIPEMDKDVKRLQLIADRFSKIGSLPEPVPASLNEVMNHVIDYMDRRTSKKVNIVKNFTEDDITVEDGSTEIIASHEPYTADGTAIETRAVLGNDGTIVNWEASDVIAVYDFTANKHSFTAEIGADGRTKFSGKVTPRKPSFAAIYPYDLAAESAASVSALSATLPSTQYAVADNIASALNISVAKGERNLDGSPSLVTFYNTCQLLRFSVPAYAAGKISSIQFTATTPIAGKLNINYSGDLPTTTIGSTESKVITILPPKNNSTFNAGTYYIAAAPGQMSGFTLTFACDGKNYTLTSPTTLAGKAGRIYSIGAIDLINTPSVSAEHIYSNDILQGTKVQLTGAPIEGGNWTATIKNANGTTVRTLSGTGDLISAETDASWPYLPKGNYTISYTFDRSNGTTQTATLPLSITDSPRFNVSFSTYTSYSYYIGDGVTKSTTEANKCANNVIYAPTLTVTGISNAILNNNNYTFTTGQTGFSTSLKSKSNGIFVFNDVTVTDWKAYTLTASLTFDGVKKEAASKTVQITGLPYTATPPRNSGDHAWSEVQGGGKIDWNSGNVALGEGGTAGADPTIKSPSFYLPANINTTVSAAGTLHTRQVWPIYYRETLKMYVGGSSVWEQTSPEKSTTAANFSLSINSQFSGSTNYLQFSVGARTELSGWARITTVKVQYR